MPFVKRDDKGAIIAVSQVEEAGFVEQLPASDEQLAEFLNEMSDGKSSLDSTDQDFIRVLEDVVELLINKSIILFTDLPDSAQHKMMQRQRMRSELNDKLNLLESD